MRRCDEISSPALSRLSRARRTGIYVIGIGVWLTGVVWLVFHYFVVYPARFGLAANPLALFSLTLHGAFAFAAIWIFGLLWGVHVPAGWSRNKRRLSGGLLAGLLGWLIVSGYLLYYVGGEEFRAAVSLVHWILGLVAPAAFVAHRLKGRMVAYVRDLIRRPFSSRPIRPEIAPAGED
jgi:hypothetical protein